MIFLVGRWSPERGNTKNGFNWRLKASNNKLFEDDQILLNSNGMELIRKNGEMKITDSTFLMLQMQTATDIRVQYPFLVVMMKKLNCRGMNEQPQQKQEQDIFSKKFQNTI